MFSTNLNPYISLLEFVASLQRSLYHLQGLMLIRIQFKNEPFNFCVSYDCQYSVLLKSSVSLFRFTVNQNFVFYIFIFIFYLKSFSSILADSISIHFFILNTWLNLFDRLIYYSLCSSLISYFICLLTDSCRNFLSRAKLLDFLSVIRVNLWIYLLQSSVYRFFDMQVS